MEEKLNPLTEDALSIYIDKDNKITLYRGNKEANYAPSLLELLNAISDLNDSDCYNAARVLQTEEKTTYLFQSNKTEENTNVTCHVKIEAANASTLLDTLIVDENEEVVSMKEQLAREVEKIENKGLERAKLSSRIISSIKERAKEKKEKFIANQDKIKRNAIRVGAIAGVSILIASSIALLKEDIELQKQNPYDYADVATDTFYATAPDEFVRDHDEEFKKDKQAYEEKERQEEMSRYNEVINAGQQETTTRAK